MKKQYFLISGEQFRDAVVNAAGFGNRDRVLFHTDETVSWEAVRSLDRMPPLLLIIRNLCTQGGAPEEVMESLEYTNEMLGRVLEEFPK